MFHDVVIQDVDHNVSAASSVNQAMGSTNYATPFAAYYDGIVVVKCTYSVYLIPKRIVAGFSGGRAEKILKPATEIIGITV